MMSHSLFRVSTEAPNDLELSMSVQADHNYSLPLIKEEECIIEDDLRVVEITEEVDVSMYIADNGSAYLQDVNGVQWNLENPNSFRLDDLSWKPMEDDVKKEVEEELIENVKFVKNCIKCKASLSSGALCVRCNQPWVQLTDICKSRNFIGQKQINTKQNKMGNLSNFNQKKFYVVKKSDVEKFVNKNMGKLNIINRYDARNVLVTNNDVSDQSDIKKQENTQEKTSTISSSNQSIIEKMDNGNIDKRSATTSDHSYTAVTANVSHQNILRKMSGRRDDTKFNFIKKLVSVDVGALNKKFPVKKDDVKGNKKKKNEKLNTASHKTKVITNIDPKILNQIIQLNQFTGKDNFKEINSNKSQKKATKKKNIQAGNVNSSQKEVTEKEDNMEEVNANKLHGMRKSALNHKFFGKNRDTKIYTQDNDDYDESENPEKKIKPKFSRVIPKNMVCVACDKHFHKFNDLCKHMEKHKPPFGCNQCNVKLLNDVELTAHSYCHNTVLTGKHKCKVCDLEMGSLSKLRTHSYTHVRNKPFPCDQCDQSFDSDSRLRTHMIKHGALPFSCKLCHRQFKRSGYLRRHYCPKRWNTQGSSGLATKLNKE